MQDPQKTDGLGTDNMTVPWRVSVGEKIAGFRICHAESVILNSSGTFQSVRRSSLSSLTNLPAGQLHRPGATPKPMMLADDSGRIPFSPSSEEAGNNPRYLIFKTF